ncbi:MAG: hypothetical protein HY810_03270 [Candidatus Omnitrophica bacterium]|nr:hypothetical protein [Candidatus Omnitrophota bacterium]
MKRKINALFFVIICIFFILLIVGKETMPGLLRDIEIFFAGIGLVTALYMLNCFAVFRAKLELALRHIMENNFDTGISLKGKDEFAVLAKKFNNAINRINEYDRLREMKMDIISRLLATLIRNISDGVMVMDITGGKIKINKAAQEIFNVNQDELSIDSVVKLAANERFNKLYMDIVNGRANTIAADLEMFLPVLRAKAVIALKMFAVKDKDERLNSILCVFTKA